MFLIDQQGNSCRVSSRVTALGRRRQEGGGGGWGVLWALQPPNRWEKVWPTAVITYFSWTNVPTCERGLDRVGGGALVLNLDQTDINKFRLNEPTFLSPFWKRCEKSAATIFLLKHTTVSSALLLALRHRAHQWFLRIKTDDRETI